MRARYYDPAAGRFVSEDPTRDGGNWCLYAGDNPTDKVDSTGRMEIADIFWTLLLAYLYDQFKPLLPTLPVKAWLEAFKDFLLGDAKEKAALGSSELTAGEVAELAGADAAAILPEKAGTTNMIGAANEAVMVIEVNEALDAAEMSDEEFDALSG
jgi:uncharacterized protein RhaS with RHS repeats